MSTAVKFNLGGRLAAEIISAALQGPPSRKSKGIADVIPLLPNMNIIRSQGEIQTRRINPRRNYVSFTDNLPPIMNIKTVCPDSTSLSFFFFYPLLLPCFVFSLSIYLSIIYSYILKSVDTKRVKYFCERDAWTSKPSRFGGSF